MELRRRFRMRTFTERRERDVSDEGKRLCVILAAALGVIVFGLVFSVGMSYAESQRQQMLAANMLRFHVIANSDSAWDQTRKTEVRDALLQYLQSGLLADADMSDRIEAVHAETDGGKIVCEETGGEAGAAKIGYAPDMEEWVREHIDEIEETAEVTLSRSGSTDTVHAAVVTCWFPDRWYDGQFYPAGNYRALRVEIGSAGGRNWWGVLCPGLCFRESVRVVYPDGRRRWLSDALSAEAYSDVTAFSEFRIKWYLWEGTGE